MQSIKGVPATRRRNTSCGDKLFMPILVVIVVLLVMVSGCSGTNEPLFADAWSGITEGLTNAAAHLVEALILSLFL